MTWTALQDNDLGFNEHYVLNKIRLFLDLDNSCWIRKYLTLLQTTLAYVFSDTKQPGLGKSNLLNLFVLLTA